MNDQSVLKPMVIIGKNHHDLTFKFRWCNMVQPDGNRPGFRVLLHKLSEAGALHSLEGLQLSVLRPAAGPRKPLFSPISLENDGTNDGARSVKHAHTYVFKILKWGDTVTDRASN